MVTRFLFYYPHLFSFFRLRNLRAFFCLRCLHQIQIHCKSVRNLRPPHAPVIAIFSLSFAIITMFSLPLPLPPPKKNKTKTKTKKAKRYLYTNGHTDRKTLTPWSSFRSWGLQLALYHQSTWFLKCNLSTATSIFPSPLNTAVTSFRTGFTQNFFKWQASS